MRRLHAWLETLERRVCSGGGIYSEIRAWTALYGSDRLKALADSEYNHYGRYARERLAMEFPGCRFGYQYTDENNLRREPLPTEMALRKDVARLLVMRGMCPSFGRAVARVKITSLGWLVFPYSSWVGYGRRQTVSFDIPYDYSRWSDSPASHIHRKHQALTREPHWAVMLKPARSGLAVAATADAIGLMGKGATMVRAAEFVEAGEDLAGRAYVARHRMQVVCDDANDASRDQEWAERERCRAAEAHKHVIQDGLAAIHELDTWHEEQFIP